MKIPKDLRENIIRTVGSPKIFVFLIIWLMILVFFGTLAQRDQGLYLVQLDYFSSWITWFGLLPTLSAKTTMLFMFINLSCYFIRPGIWSIQKIGITITHSGVMLLLFGSGLTSLFSLEGSMIIDEGKRSNYFENYYMKEFVIIDKSNQEFNEYTIFDEYLLNKNSSLKTDNLPFDLFVIDYFVNCQPVQRVYLGNENFQGMAKNFYLEKLKSEKEYEQNRPGIIFEILGKEDTSVNGIYILFMGQTIPHTLKMNNHEFDLQIRPYRTYLPFEIELIDFKKEIHPGTDVAKSFSSSINLIEDDIKRKVLIEMNAPFRHYNYTFYQASFIEQNNIETTVLATVQNYGRTFPYISSIIMCIGILMHMLIMVSKRFKKSTGIKGQ